MQPLCQFLQYFGPGKPTNSVKRFTSKRRNYLSDFPGGNSWGEQTSFGNSADFSYGRIGRKRKRRR
jgi:hypothetical protein